MIELRVEQWMKVGKWKKIGEWMESWKVNEYLTGNKS